MKSTYTNIYIYISIYIQEITNRGVQNNSSGKRIFFKPHCHLLLQDKIKMVFQCLPLLYLLRNITLDNYFWNRASQNTNQNSLPKMKGCDFDSQRMEKTQVSSPHTLQYLILKTTQPLLVLVVEFPVESSLCFGLFCCFFKPRGIFGHVFPRNFCWNSFFGEKERMKDTKAVR